MESKFYADFVLSHDYTQFVCQSESAMDDMRAHLTQQDEEDLPSFDWSDGFNFKERVRHAFHTAHFVGKLKAGY